MNKSSSLIPLVDVKVAPRGSAINEVSPWASIPSKLKRAAYWMMLFSMKTLWWSCGPLFCESSWSWCHRKSFSISHTHPKASLTFSPCQDFHNPIILGFSTVLVWINLHHFISVRLVADLVLPGDSPALISWTGRLLNSGVSQGPKTGYLYPARPNCEL